MAVYHVETDQGTFEVTTDEGNDSSGAGTYQPTLLDKASDAIKGVGNAVAPYVAKAAQGANVLGLLSNPLQGAMAISANKLAGGLEQGADAAGDAVAEKGGELGAKYGLDPHFAAALGLATQFAANPLNYAGGEAKAPVNLSAFVPKVGVGQQALVDAANRMGVPLSRAEIVGGKPMQTLETGLEATPLGSGPINQFRTQQGNAIDAVGKNLEQTMGTSASPMESGQVAQAGLQAQRDALKAQKSALYDARDAAVIPGQNVDPTNLKSVAQQLLQDQSELLPQNRDPKISGLASSILNNDPTSPGVGNFSSLIKNRAIFAANAKDPAFRQLRDAADADIEQFFKDAPGEAGKNNALAGAVYKQLKDQYERSKFISSLIDPSKTPPEKVVDKIFKPQNASAINEFKAAAPSQAWNQVKASFTQDLVKAKDPLSELQKFDGDTLQAIFSPDDLQKIKDYGLLKSGSKGADYATGNTTRTARNLQMGTVFTSLSTPLAMAFHSPAAALTGVGAAAAALGVPRLVAKGYTSNFARNGIQTSIRPAIQTAASVGLRSAFNGASKK